MSITWARRVLPATALIFLCAQTTPPGNPVVAHFRAYQAALQANDLPTAETEAEAALAASVARDGQGGRTGVLAINLAQVRLMRGRAAEAYDPAQQALQISNNADSGVDPLLARLTLGRAELTEQRYRQGRDRIEAALRDAVARPELHSEAYSAARELGMMQMRQERYSAAAETWPEAIRFADLVPGDTTYIRAESRMGLGIAQFFTSMDTLETEYARGDTNLRMDVAREFGAARTAFGEAAAIMRSVAFRDSENLELTRAQRIYGRALAWRNALDTYLYSGGNSAALNRILGDAMQASQQAQSDPEPVQGACRYEVDSRPRPQFPPSARSRFSVGAVVVRILLDESGRVRDTRVAGAIPDNWFAEAVETVAPQWTVTPSPDNAATCGRIIFWTIQFRFE